jgi:hypothetical protein
MKLYHSPKDSYAGTYIHTYIHSFPFINLLIPRRCPSILAALKPEKIHLFYASLEIAVQAIEAIRLVIQIPLRTERRTYLIYAPVTL